MIEEAKKLGKNSHTEPGNCGCIDFALLRIKIRRRITKTALVFPVGLD